MAIIAYVNSTALEMCLGIMSTSFLFCFLIVPMISRSMCDKQQLSCEAILTTFNSVCDNKVLNVTILFLGNNIRSWLNITGIIRLITTKIHVHV